MQVSITTILLSSTQSLLSNYTLYFVVCIRKVRYISPTLLPGSTLNLWIKKSSTYPPKWCLWYWTGKSLQIYCAKSQFLLEFAMILLPKHKIKILCVFSFISLSVFEHVVSSFKTSSYIPFNAENRWPLTGCVPNIFKNMNKNLTSSLLCRRSFL